MKAPGPQPIDDWLEHESWLRSIAARLARDSAEVDELVQQTWLVALERPPLDLSRDPRGWLRRVLQNVQRQLIRGDSRRARREKDAGDAKLGVPTPEEIEQRLEVRRQVLDEVQQLQEPYRRLLVMRYFEGRSLVQIARDTNTSRETLKSQQKRALGMLRERLDRRVGGDLSWFAVFAPFLPPRPETGVLIMNSGAKIGLAIGALVLLGVTATMFVGGPAIDRRSSAQLDASGPVRSKSPDPGLIESKLEDTAGSSRSQVAPVQPAEQEAAPKLVRGRVLTPSGKPVSGALVSGDGRSVEASRDGEFEWELGADPVQLRPFRAGMTEIVLGWARPDSPREITLVLAPILELGGWVVNEDDLPIPGAAVRVQLDETWARQLPMGLAGGTTSRWSTIADEFGGFHLPELPQVADALIWVRDGGRTSLFQLPAESRMDLRLVLREPTEDERWANIPHLSGRLLHADGRAATEGRVDAGDYSRACEAGGHFRLPLSVIEERDSFRVTHLGLLPLVVNRPGGSQSPWPDSLEVRLPGVEVGSLRGRVTDSEGVPLVDRDVWLVDPTPRFDEPHPEWVEAMVGRIAATTDEQGRFTLTALPERDYRVAAFDEASMKRVLSGPARVGDHSLQLVFDGRRDEHEFFGRCLAPDGSPLASVTIAPLWRVRQQRGAQDHRAGEAQTDEQGYFRFESIPSGFESLECSGREIMPQVVSIEDSSVTGKPLILRRRGELRVSTSLERADYFMLLDPSGRAMELYRFQWIMEGKVEGSDITSWGRLEQGESTTYAVPEGNYEVRVFYDEEVLGTADCRVRAAQRAEVQID